MRTREHLIQAGISNLKKFGYPDVSADNILTDYVFASMFHSMLVDNKGHGRAQDEVINALLAEIEEKKRAP